MSSTDADLIAELDALPALPLDDDGFVRAFDLGDVDAIRAFHDLYGFVCIRDVLLQAEIDATNDELFSKFDRSDAASIEAFFADEQFAGMGFVGITSDISRASLMMNRQSPRLYDAYRALLECDELWVDSGRMGVLRPTRFGGVERPTWKSLDRWLHIDSNPITGRIAVASFANGHLPVPQLQTAFVRGLPQGLLAMTDAPVEAGGFHCVPGSHAIAERWAARNDGASKRGGMMLVDPTSDAALMQRIRKIPVRAGTLVTWRHDLFHGNFPNTSETLWRVCQYVRMYPATGNRHPFAPLWPRAELLATGTPFTPLGRKLFGLDEWTSSSATSACSIQ